jgi:predicted 3-demethylubiquinone-9 3-methyltransferase (glyoxalase superfamily)
MAKNTICLWYDKDAEALAAGGDEAKRAFEAMMGMRKIDIAAIEAALRG